MGNKQTMWVILIIVGVLVGGAAAWYFVSPLFIDNTVDEAFPFEMPEAADMSTMSDAEMRALESEFMAAVPGETELEAMTADDRQAVEKEVLAAAAMVMTDKVMAEEAPAAEWTLVAEGTFAGSDDFHQGSGQASIYQMGEERVLRFEDFEVTNGPDLHVILSTNPNPTGRDDIGEYIDLGSLKGNIGGQNYELAADLDLSQYQSVVIYCQPFHVVFATAPLAVGG